MKKNLTPLLAKSLQGVPSTYHLPTASAFYMGAAAMYEALVENDQARGVLLVEMQELSQLLRERGEAASLAGRLFPDRPGPFPPAAEEQTENGA